MKRWEWGAEICPREEMGAPKAADWSGPRQDLVSG